MCQLYSIVLPICCPCGILWLLSLWYLMWRSWDRQGTPQNMLPGTWNPTARPVWSDDVRRDVHNSCCLFVQAIWYKMIIQAMTTGRRYMAGLCWFHTLHRVALLHSCWVKRLPDLCHRFCDVSRVLWFFTIFLVKCLSLHSFGVPCALDETSPFYSSFLRWGWQVQLDTPQEEMHMVGELGPARVVSWQGNLRNRWRHVKSCECDM